MSPEFRKITSSLSLLGQQMSLAATGLDRAEATLKRIPCTVDPETSNHSVT